MGAPVFRAKITGPGLATYRGPRGPSIVNAAVLPCPIFFAISTNPRIPPREELPCEEPYPSLSITRRVHCPSKFVVFITTTPRFRYLHAAEKMQRCQNAAMHGRPAPIQSFT